jgi:DNA polymerase III subunit delta'
MTTVAGEVAPEPRRMVELIGHDEPARLLAEAYDSGRLHHAWLLGGPQGIGKATLAYRFARHVLAGEPVDMMAGDLVAAGAPFRMDPSHPVFRRVAVGSHPDLLTIERSLNPRGVRRTEIVIDDVRVAGEFLRKTPSESRWRVVIIDGADDLNANAANALLKLLEEPPANSLLLLVSHSPARLLPTIRSRCRRLILRAPDVADAVQILRTHRPELDEEQAGLLVRLADARPGVAAQLASQGGIELFQTLMTLLRRLPEVDVALLHTTAERFGRASEEQSFRTFVGLLSWWIDRLVRGSASDFAEFAEIVPGELAVAGRLASGVGLERWCEVWDKIGHLVASAGSLNLDRRQVVLDIVLGLQAAFRPAGAVPA